MTKPLPFTQAAIERAIKAAEKRGYRVGGVKPDGTVLVYSGDDRPPGLSLASTSEQDAAASEWEVFRP